MTVAVERNVLQRFRVNLASVDGSQAAKFESARATCHGLGSTLVLEEKRNQDQRCLMFGFGAWAENRIATKKCHHQCRDEAASVF